MSVYFGCTTHACLKDDKMMSNIIISQSLKDKRWITLDRSEHHRRHSFTFSLGTEIKAEWGQRAGEAWNQRLHWKRLGLFLIQNFFPLALAQLLKCRSEETSLCPALAREIWNGFFIFLGIIMGKYHSQRQRINTAVAGLITVGWRDEKEPFIKLWELLERIKYPVRSVKHRGSVLKQSELHFKTLNA